jgi:RHS repeat-associated protein
LNGRTVNYAYDAVYKLTGETISNDPIAANNGSISYGYDAVGNRLSRTSSIAAVPSTSSSYDANDRLAGDTYDFNGNTLEADGVAYAYDLENRITSVNDGAVTIVYDGDGNRVMKTVGGVTTRYLVDDLNPPGYAQVVEEIVDGFVGRVYTYGNGLVSEDEIGGDGAPDALRREDALRSWLVQPGHEAHFYGHDGQGSVRFLTDSNGVVTDRYDYDAFGNLISQTGGTPNNYLYSGEQYDGDIGGYYLRARYYNQPRGRFLSTDSFPGINFNPLTLHKYVYAHDDPVNLLDATGTRAVEYALRLRTTVSRETVVAVGQYTFALLCGLYRAASVVYPEINPVIPFPFNPLCVTEERKKHCKRKLQECLKWAAKASHPKWVARRVHLCLLANAECLDPANRTPPQWPHESDGGGGPFGALRPVPDESPDDAQNN